jgi:protein-serine/threonine kinase
MTTNKYHPICTLGRGGQGFVLRAKSEEGDVAIKVTQKKDIHDWIQDQDVIPYELYCLKTVSHKNIVSVIDYYQDENFYYYVMPLPQKYVTHQMEMMYKRKDPSIDLFELIESYPVNEAMAKSLFCQAIDAVSHLHEVGIAHGDIKDENFLVDSNLQLYLIDFGSARPVGSTNPSIFKGTVQYAAPELFGKEHYDSVPADVWSLGIVLYILLFKRLPFCSLSEVKMIPPPYYSGQDKAFDLVQKLLEKNPKRRWTLEQAKLHPWLL